MKCGTAVSWCWWKRGMSGSVFQLDDWIFYHLGWSQLSRKMRGRAWHLYKQRSVHKLLHSWQPLVWSSWTFKYQVSHPLPATWVQGRVCNGCLCPPACKCMQKLPWLSYRSPLQNKRPCMLLLVTSMISTWDTLPVFQQHIVSTRGDNSLNKVYTNRWETYRTFPPRFFRPHLHHAGPCILPCV